MALLGTNTGSIIDDPKSGGNSTRTGISTNIVVKVGNTAVGAIQSIHITEKRTVHMIDEIGTDGHIDSVPIKATDISGTCTRTRFDLLRMTEAFSRDFLHVHAQRIPFDIDIYDNWNGNGSNAIITTIRNVWITNLDYNIQAENWIIIDNMTFEAEAIYSTLNGGNAATSGARGFALDRNSIELQADAGLRRGALDAPNLINDFFTNI